MWQIVSCLRIPPLIVEIVIRSDLSVAGLEAMRCFGDCTEGGDGMPYPVGSER